MSQSQADRFKTNAQQCRRAAADAHDEPDRRAWLRLAEEWEKLAENADLGQGIFKRYD